MLPWGEASLPLPLLPLLQLSTPLLPLLPLLLLPLLLLSHVLLRNLLSLHLFACMQPPAGFGPCYLCWSLLALACEHTAHKDKMSGPTCLSAAGFPIATW